MMSEKLLVVFISFFRQSLLLVVLSAQPLWSQPKFEFRGVWVTTVTNIDWPSAKGLSSSKQQEEFIRLLDQHKKNGLNAVIVQVRPAADAFYASSKEPWSEWLTGKQGKAPEPFYDPLKFMVDACHERALEFHAWINPFRAVLSEKSKVADDHISKKKPDWLLRYGQMQILNPGLPEVRNYITGVVADIASRYDIDAIHFDDYFYPYPIQGIELNDNLAFSKYNPQQLNKADWRRANINHFIKNVHDTLAQIAPRVKFGISPFGIWRNQSSDPNGSATNGLSAYDHLHADVLTWLEKGWIDYVAPQVYWSKDFKPASYDTLVTWWSKNNFNRHLYIGHAVSKIESKESEPFSEATILDQIRVNRKTKSVNGSIFYSSRQLYKIGRHLTDSMREKYYHRPALLPPMAWKDSLPPERPRKLKISRVPKGNYISWTSPKKAIDNEYPFQYVVYRFDQASPIDLTSSTNIVNVLASNHLFFLDTTAVAGKNYHYEVTALDRMQNESDVPFAIQSMEASPEISTVNILPHGAQVVRTAQLQLPRGVTRIVIKNLPKKIIPQSILASAGVAQIIKTEHQLQWPKPENGNAQKNSVITDSIRLLDRRMQLIQDSLYVSELTENALLQNQRLGNDNQAVQVSEIQALMQYFPKKLLALKEQQRRLKTEAKLIQLKLERLKASQHSPFRRVEELSLIEVMVQADQAITIPFELSYQIKEAGWIPEYDLFTSNDSSIVSLRCKVKLWQNTGEDWEEVKINLTSLANSSHESDSISFEDDRILYDSPGINSTAGHQPIFIPIEQSLTVDSDNHIHTIHFGYKTMPTIRVHEIQLTQSSVNLHLKIPSWRKYSLPGTGRLHLFNNKVYLHSTVLKTDDLKDTLSIALNADNRIAFEKTLVEEKVNKFLLIKIIRRSYKIAIRNNTSTNALITAEESLGAISSSNLRIYASDARQSRSPLTLTWSISLAAYEQRLLEYSYRKIEGIRSLQRHK